MSSEVSASVNASQWARKTRLAAFIALLFGLGLFLALAFTLGVGTVLIALPLLVMVVRVSRVLLAFPLFSPHAIFFSGVSPGRLCGDSEQYAEKRSAGPCLCDGDVDRGVAGLLDRRALADHLFGSQRGHHEGLRGVPRVTRSLQGHRWGVFVLVCAAVRVADHGLQLAVRFHRLEASRGRQTADVENAAHRPNAWPRFYRAFRGRSGLFGGTRLVKRDGVCVFDRR